MKLRIICWAMLMSGIAAVTVSGQTEYRLPPPEVVEIVDAAPEPNVSISPDGQWMLLIESRSMPGIEDVARRMLQLAGTRIDPQANSRFRTDFDRGLQIRPLTQDRPTRIPLREEPRIGSLNWSHNSQAFAYTLVTDAGTELWVVDVLNPTKPRRLTDRLSTVLCDWAWTPAGDQLICCLVPADRGAEPQPPTRPIGPNIQESSGNTSPTRTYQDLLANPYDEALFEYYGTTQLAIIDMAGNVTPIGQPALFAGVEFAPDGEHLLVTTIERPFSYLLPYGDFPQKIAVWNRAGDVVHLVADVPLAENIPIEGVRLGPRSVAWASSEPATLHWVEALDGGDPSQPADFRDRLFRLSAPFETKPTAILEIQHRSAGITYFDNPDLLAISDYDRDRRWVRTLLYDFADPDAPPATLVDRSIRDAYGDPGRIMQVANDRGHAMAQQSGESIFFSGMGATPDGYLPFLDRFDLTTGESARLWRCESGSLEMAVKVLQSDSNSDSPAAVVTRHENPQSPPNYRLRSLDGSSPKTLTQFADPTPQIRNIQKQLVTYQRADGVPLSATLYLPADYQPGTRLPLLVWAYPLEYNDPSTAGQVRGSPDQFTRMNGLSHLTLLTQGYAIFDSATMPVVGDPETMNDTFVEQIVASAQAAIDKAVEMGVADRDRVAVGGHSYGAFMTANLMAHCDLFRAGIARSGAYNRTLTPFGFQSERRPFWKAPQIYFNVSPFSHADKIKEPILLIHGENDNNSGTFPIQSQRMYQAIKGNGGTVRLVMLPYESHGYRARESVLHTQAEMIDWLNRYVRDVDVQP